MSVHSYWLFRVRSSEPHPPINRDRRLMKCTRGRSWNFRLRFSEVEAVLSFLGCCLGGPPSPPLQAGPHGGYHVMGMALGLCAKPACTCRLCGTLVSSASVTSSTHCTRRPWSTASSRSTLVSPAVQLSRPKPQGMYLTTLVPLYYCVGIAPFTGYVPQNTGTTGYVPQNIGATVPGCSTMWVWLLSQGTYPQNTVPGWSTVWVWLHSQGTYPQITGTIVPGCSTSVWVLPH